jgi:hypothetical protein
VAIFVNSLLGTRKQEAGSRKQKSEIRKQKAEIRNQKSDIKKVHPIILVYEKL